MSTASHDTREFLGTYFSLRVALIASSLVVFAAPLSILLVQHTLPPSISDSWYTDAQPVFVVGLAAGAFLLIVVRGDTLTEQTLLNLAGGLGLIVAGAACWPKDSHGDPLPAYDPTVATHNRYAVWSLLAIGAVGWVLAEWVLPAQIIGTGWKTRPVARRVLKAAYPAAMLLIALLMVVKPVRTPEHIHGTSATVMFLLLAVVAFLRTTWGLALLRRIGDTPVDDSISANKVAGDQRASVSTFNRIYVTVAAAMAGVVTAAVVLILEHAAPGWVIFVEIAMLALFGVFWGTQTREAWLERGGGTPG